MKAWALLFLRLSLALLMVIWGVDKLVNPSHGVRVAETFYLGILDSSSVMPALGVGEIVLGLGLAAGVLRRWMYPVLLAVTGVTLLGVWRSIVDPWGWFLEGSNVLFFPSLIIFAAALVLFAFRDEDRFAANDALSQPENARRETAGSQEV